MSLRLFLIALIATLLSGCETIEPKSAFSQPPQPGITTLPPIQAIGGTRKALVMGNAHYPPQDGQSMTLTNPINDATAMAERLRHYGFEVTPVLDAGPTDMKNAIDAFVARLNRNDVALVYYSGHGNAVTCRKGEEQDNYLIPIPPAERPFKSSSDVCKDAISARWLLDRLNERDGGANLLLLDACRTVLRLGPEDKGGRQSKGFVEMHGTGSFIGYASAPRQPAEGNPDGRYSRFTEHLLAALAPPYDDWPLESLFKRVRAGVADAADRMGEQQVSWMDDGLVGDFCFQSPCRSLADPVTNQAELEQARQAKERLDRLEAENRRLREQVDQKAQQAERAVQAAEQRQQDAERAAQAARDLAAQRQREAEARERQAEQDRVAESERQRQQREQRQREREPQAALLPISESPRQSFEPAMVAIPGGDFQMGSPEGEADRGSNEGPVHPVHVNAFAMGKYEVTQRQWEAVMGSNPSVFTNCPECPVEYVSWNDIQDYLHRLGEKTGKTYRLPTEAEWEYACRGGVAGETYCGSNDFDRVSWDIGYTHPVGGKAPNGFGLYDMSGDVFEWTCSAYNGEYNGDELSCKNGANIYVLRGSSWYERSPWQGLRSAHRHYGSPGDRLGSNGFRVALPLRPARRAGGA